MKPVFNPLRSQPGELRVALCLTALHEQAFTVLQLSESLGFERPQFMTDEPGNMWAIVLQQFHAYEADPLVTVEPWARRMQALWQACEPDSELKVKGQDSSQL